MRLDLRGVGIPAQLLRSNELAAQFDPVDIGARAVEGVVVADRAIPFGEDLHRFEPPSRALQARTDVGHLLAEGGGACTLAVGAREHRQLGMRSRQRAQRRQQRVELRQQYLHAGLLQQPRIAQVVDVLRGAAEMHQLQRRAGRAGSGQLVTHEVLHCLDVVIDALIDDLDRFGGVGPRVARQAGIALEHRWRQCAGEQAQPWCRELLEPQRLDTDAFADQRGLGKISAQRRRDGGVTPVHGREGGQS